MKSESHATFKSKHLNSKHYNLNTSKGKDVKRSSCHLITSCPFGLLSQHLYPWPRQVSPTLDGQPQINNIQILHNLSHARLTLINNPRPLRLAPYSSHRPQRWGWLYSSCSAAACLAPASRPSLGMCPLMRTASLCSERWRLYWMSTATSCDAPRSNWCSCRKRRICRAEVQPGWQFVVKWSLNEACWYFTVQDRNLCWKLMTTWWRTCGN